MVSDPIGGLSLLVRGLLLLVLDDADPCSLMIYRPVMGTLLLLNIIQGLRLESGAYLAEGVTSKILLDLVQVIASRGHPVKEILYRRHPIPYVV